jgi:hypothetical protein
MYGHANISVSIHILPEGRMKGRAAWRASTGLLDSSEGISIPHIANPDRICVFRGVPICILSVFLEKKHVLLRCEPPGFFRETHVRISFT